MPADLAAAVEQTILVLQPQVADSLQLSTRLLSRPPFSFLEAVITAIMKNSPFGRGLYAAEELTSANLNSKKGRLFYLVKILHCVSAAIDEYTELLVNPAKIIAGQEPVATNIFLQHLARASTVTQDKAEAAVQQTVRQEPAELYQAASHKRRMLIKCAAVLKGVATRRRLQCAAEQKDVQLTPAWEGSVAPPAHLVLRVEIPSDHPAVLSVAAGKEKFDTADAAQPGTRRAVGGIADPRPARRRNRAESSMRTAPSYNAEKERELSAREAQLKQRELRLEKRAQELKQEELQLAARKQSQAQRSQQEPQPQGKRRRPQGHAGGGQANRESATVKPHHRRRQRRALQKGSGAASGCESNGSEVEGEEDSPDSDSKLREWDKLYQDGFNKAYCDAVSRHELGELPQLASPLMRRETNPAAIWGGCLPQLASPSVQHAAAGQARRSQSFPADPALRHDAGDQSADKNSRVPRSIRGFGKPPVLQSNGAWEGGSAAATGGQAVDGLEFWKFVAKRESSKDAPAPEQVSKPKGQKRRKSKPDPPAYVQEEVDRYLSNLAVLEDHFRRNHSRLSECLTSHMIKSGGSIHRMQQGDLQAALSMLGVLTPDKIDFICRYAFVQLLNTDQCLDVQLLVKDMRRGYQLHKDNFAPRCPAKSEAQEGALRRGGRDADKAKHESRDWLNLFDTRLEKAMDDMAQLCLVHVEGVDVPLQQADDF